MNSLSFGWVTSYGNDRAQILPHRLMYIFACIGYELVAFVNVAWDGDVHGFTEVFWGKIKRTLSRMDTR